MLKIVPSILTNNPEELVRLLKRCEGLVERVSIDIIDGKFAKNKTIYPDVLGSIETDLKLDFHLMVIEPINWVEGCVRNGADRIIGQIEKMSDQIGFVAKVQEVGAGVGLGIDLETPVSSLEPTILSNLDLVLVMSVSAGFGGQEFDGRVLEKLKRLDEIRSNDDTPFKIQDDGGIVFDKIDDVHLAGVEEVSIGRRLFDGDLAKNIEKFQKAAHKMNY